MQETLKETTKAQFCLGVSCIIEIKKSPHLVFEGKPMETASGEWGLFEVSYRGCIDSPPCMFLTIGLEPVSDITDPNVKVEAAAFIKVLPSSYMVKKMK